MKKIAVLVVSAAAFVVIGCQVSKPGSVESSVAKTIKTKMTVGGKDDKNPIAYSPDAAKEGGEHFQHHCQICHGLDGQNTGVPFAGRLSPPVPELISPAVQAYRDGQLKWVIDNGIFPSGMPASKGTLSDEEIWQIVHYIRHLPARGSLGDPVVYGGTPPGK